MDFLDTIFSFIPLLMIILFVTRIVKASGKNKRPKPLNTIPSAENEDQKGQAKPEPSPKAGIFSEATEDFAALFEKLSGNKKSSHHPAKTENAEESNPSAPKPAPIPPPIPQQQGINTLQKANDAYRMRKIQQDKIQQTEPEPPMAYRRRARVNDLPELKKAVIWAEILGKPKGLE